MSAVTTAAMTAALRATILYLDGVSVSFDGFKALNDLSLVPGQGRAARHHRPERRRQDHDDGRHHRQDPARQGHRPVPRGRRPHPLDEAEIARLGIGRKFQKPTVFESHTVFTNLELALKGERALFRSLCSACPASSATASTRCWASSA